MPRRRLSLALVVAVSLLAALPVPAAAVLPGVNGRIVFASGRGGTDATAKLYMRTFENSAGAGSVFPISTTTGDQHRHPSWSPDRTKVVYAAGPVGGPFTLYIAGVPSGPSTPVADSSATTVAGDHPAWSPDGTRIAFEQGGDIKVYDVATHAIANLTNDTADESTPAWSPDSQTIYYAKGDQASGGQNIMRRPASGGAETLAIVDMGDNEFEPSISPDGSRICFTQQVKTNESTADVVVEPITIPPAAIVVLSQDNPTGADYDCTWSPDGRFIAYVRGAGSSGAIVFSHSDATDSAPVTLVDSPGVFDGDPDWAPDGPPSCRDVTIQAVQGKKRRIPLPCHDTGPAYERTAVREAIAGGSHPAHGKLGEVRQNDPSTVRYTANRRYLGPDSFEFVGLGINGGSDRGLVSITVVKSGKCANMQTGSSKRDRLVGTIGGDRLLGLDGNDRLVGLSGRDCLSGGAGNDHLNGGSWGDTLKGEKGRDTLTGGRGADVLDGGSGKDKFNAGPGKDRIDSADGHQETVYCGAGSDRVLADHKDKLHGCEHVRRK